MALEPTLAWRVGCGSAIGVCRGGGALAGTCVRKLLDDGDVDHGEHCDGMRERMA